jgi:hypothetical protein
MNDIGEIKTDDGSERAKNEGVFGAGANEGGD